MSELDPSEEFLQGVDVEQEFATLARAARFSVMASICNPFNADWKGLPRLEAIKNEIHLPEQTHPKAFVKRNQRLVDGALFIGAVFGGTSLARVLFERE